MTKKHNMISLYLLLLPIIDVITSLMTRFGNFNLSLGIIVKGITSVFLMLYIFIWSKSKWRRKSIIYLGIIIIYFIFYFMFKREIFVNHNYLNEIINAFKYNYFIIVLLGIINIFDDYKYDGKKIRNIFLISSFMYAFLLLIPIVTNTSFSSYNSVDIGGDNGWFYAANEIGVITILLLLGTTYLLDNKNKWYIIGFVPILLSISLIGTKVSYFGMIIAVIILAIFNIIKNKKNGIISSVILLIILYFACNFSPAMSNLDSTDKRIEEDKKNHTNYKIEDFIHNKLLVKIIMVGLNGREEFFINDVGIFCEGDISHKLFGLGFSNYDNNNEDDIDYYNKLVEIDYMDIFFRYGIIGFIIYFVPLLCIIINFFKSKKMIETYEYALFLGLIVLISSIAGHVFAAPAVSVYLALIVYMMHDSYIFELNDKEITIMSLHLGHGGIEKYISSLCKMLEDDYKINIISTYKLMDNPAYDFSKKINITYLIDCGPNTYEINKAIRDKNIKNIIKEGLISLKILYKKYSLNIKSIKNIHSKYIITTRDFHNFLVGNYADKDIIKIATEHNYHNNNRKYYDKVSKSVRGFDYFVLVSISLRDFYQDKVYGPKCIYIPNTIDELPKESSKLTENNLISVGRLVKEKGFSDLIDTINLVKKDIPNIKLYLIGDGNKKEELERKINSLNLNNNIILTGYLNQNEIAKYLKKSKLYVMTSYTESFGIVLIEAMSYKVPCIAFDSANGAKELLKDNVGILIKDRNKEEMAKKIINLLNNDKELYKYSESGFNKCKMYLIDNVKKEWLTILK